MSANKTLSEILFENRIAKVRMRFITKLAETMRVTSDLPRLAGDGSAAVEAVATTYHLFHDMAGIGSTIGFEATGQAARTLDTLLMGPFRDQRGLRGDEVTRLKDGLRGPSDRGADGNSTKGLRLGVSTVTFSRTRLLLTVSILGIAAVIGACADKAAILGSRSGCGSPGQGNPAGKSNCGLTRCS